MRLKLKVMITCSLLLGGVLLVAQPPGGFGGPPPTAFLTALDVDDDHALPKSEIEGAVAALTKLDKDGDGKLSNKETEWPPLFGDRSTGAGDFPFPPPPALAAIDADSNNVISAKELANAVVALKTLDENKDGQIDETEMQPDFGGGGGQGRGGRGGFGGGPSGRFGGGRASGKRLSPEELTFNDGAARIADHATYHKLSYRGPEVMIDSFLADLEFVKFTIEAASTDKPQFYFINTKTHRGHPMFAGAVGLPNSRGSGGDQMKGVLVYRPMLKSPSGQPGLYTFEFEPFDQYGYRDIRIAYDLLVDRMPVLKGNLGYYPRDRGINAYERDKAIFDKSDIPVFLDKDLTHSDIGYLPLNPAVSFGLLRLMTHEERPSPRDVVIYRSLPNELSRVAGVITEVRQTPLSHVNLRAVQDGVPNAFIAAASEHQAIKPLIGKYVRYAATKDGFEIRSATSKEVETYFKDLRPSKAQTPERDLTVKTARPLSEIQFGDSASVGVKAANLAAMRNFKLTEGTIPNGSAVPFYFYDEFMKHNDFYGYLDMLLKSPEFKKDRDTQDTELKKFRSLIKKGKMPDWMMASLATLHATYPEGTSLRCRSSTNNEDLPGFSGAGLYDSCTHKPDEGHLSKSIKQVYASMWNFRAFEEREFYRVDHSAAAMGVLIHPNFKGERANGVAVTDDILYQTKANYYVNTQVGEDLVTNPDIESAPEELLLAWYKEDGDRVMQRSNQTKNDKPLLSENHLERLRKHLGQIHGKFAKLYGRSSDDERFAMEIEFKITKDGQLVIKQARPWVYSQR